ncbi:hypothetical protein Tco_1051074 [Tanacetum coccineum]
MDVNAMNKTPTSNNLNVNTHESVAIHMVEDVVEATVADPFVKDEIIDNVVVVDDGVLVSSSSQKSNGKKKPKELALPFNIFHKNKGRTQRIQKIQAKKFKIDDQGTGQSTEKALKEQQKEQEMAMQNENTVDDALELDPPPPHHDDQEEEEISTPTIAPQVICQKRVYSLIDKTNTDEE